MFKQTNLSIDQAFTRKKPKLGLSNSLLHNFGLSLQFLSPALHLVGVVPRLHLVAAHQTSPFHLTSRSHPARRQQRPRCRGRACCRFLLLPLYFCCSILPLPLWFCWLACFSMHPLHCAATAAWLFSCGRPILNLTSPPVFLQRPAVPALLAHPVGRLVSSVTALARPASCKVGAEKARPLLPFLPPMFVPLVALTHFFWCVKKWFSQMARLRSFLRSGTGEVLLLPASGREVGVVCGGEERNDDVRCFVECAKGTTQLLWTSWASSHTHVRVKVNCAQTCATQQDWETCACDRVFCPHPPLAREPLFPVGETPWKNLRMRKNLAMWLPHRFCKKSVASLFSHLLSRHWWSCHWVSWCSGHWEWRWWKKVARNKSSNFDTSIPVLLVVLHRMVFASFSPSSEKRNSVVLVLVEDLREFRSGSEIFSCFHWSRLTISIVACQRHGALVPVPLMPGSGARDVDRREVVQVSATFFRPSMGMLRISVLLILVPPDVNSVLTTFPCSSSGIQCFPMILLPLSFAMLR